MSQHTFTVTYSVTLTAPSRDMAASYARQMVEHGHDAIEARDATGAVILGLPTITDADPADTAAVLAPRFHPKAGA